MTRIAEMSNPNEIRDRCSSAAAIYRIKADPDYREPELEKELRNERADLDDDDDESGDSDRDDTALEGVCENPGARSSTSP